MTNFVIHDSFIDYGGAERLALILASGIKADILCANLEKEKRITSLFQGKIFSFNFPFRQRSLVLLLSCFYFFTHKNKTKCYKNKIYSGIAAPFASLPKKKGKQNIYYCNAPPRFLYDLRERNLRKSSLIYKFFFYIFSFFFEFAFKKALENMDIIIANSINIQDRIKKYLNLDSIVIYPPCDTKKFRWISQGDYYLSTARLHPLKRVDKIVEAFLQMPDKKLIVASGGPLECELREKAKNAPNITFTSWVDEQKLDILYGNAIATIYIPIDEDFGLSPVESMSAGKPTIGTDEGGLKETIIHKKTGYLIPPNPNVDDLIQAVHYLTPTQCLKMKKACEARAQDFSQDIFIKKIQELLI